MKKFNELETLKHVIKQGYIDKVLLKLIHNDKEGLELLAEKYHKKLEELTNKTDREIHEFHLKATLPELTDKQVTECINRIYG